MDLSRRTLLVAGIALLAGCGGDDSSPPPPPPPPPPAPIALPFSFATNFAGWEASYADYTLGQEPSIAFSFGHERLPPPLDNSSGIFLTSQNRSDDVFMYIFRLVDGLTPGRSYRADISITFATNAPPGCVGIGGAPGENVAIKAGATNLRPGNVVQQGNRVTTNFDKGNQSQGGANAIVIGDFTQPNPGGSCLQPTYQRKTLSTGGNGPVVASDSSGRLWLVIGTDSGFEGQTRIYFLEGTATLTPV